MRRVGYEFQVSRPRVIIKEIDGIKHEPYEYVVVDAPSDTIGSVIEMLGSRKGNMEQMTTHENQTRVTYTMPSRGLIGFNTDFMTVTKGYGMLSHVFLEYREMENVTVGERVIGVLVCVDQGQSTAYSIGALEDRGVMFIAPGVNCYEGMIVGECNRDLDLAVNVVKAKAQSNTRSSSKDTTVVLRKPRLMTLEACLEYINEDELVEITPKSIRLRKKILDTNERKKYDSRRRRDNENE